MNSGQGQPQGQPQPNTGAGAGVQQQQQQQQPQQQQPRPQQPPGQQQPQVQQQQGLLFRPEQLKNIPGLSAEERTKYTQGLESLWQTINTTPQESPENKAARNKISNFSNVLSTRLRDRKLKAGEEAKAKAELQGQQGRAAQQISQPAQKQGVPQQQQPQPQQQKQTPAQVQAQAPAGQPQAQQTMATNTGGVPQNGNSAAPPQGGQAQTQPPQANTLPESIAAHLRTIQFKTPPQFADKPSSDLQKWFTEMRTKYGRALFSLESSRAKVKTIEKQLAARQQSNNPLPEEELKKILEQKTVHQKQQLEASRWIDNFRRQHLKDSSAVTANVNAAQKPDTARANTPAAPQNIAQGNNNPTPAVANSAAADVPKVQPQQTPVPPPRVPQASDTSSNNNQGPPQPAQPTHNSQPSSQPVQPQIPAAAQRPPQPQQAPTNSPHPAQQQSAAAQNPAAQRVQTPQNTTPANPGGPTRALSHSAAMTLANQRAATGTAPSQGQQHSGTPTSAGPTTGPHPVSQQPAPQTPHHQMQHQQPQQGHPHAHPTQQQPTMQSKMPIPKALPDKTTAVPQGVMIGGGVKAGRPTVSQGSGTLGGVMNQPAVNRIPAFNNEAEHDHVLSKKKLDELVRQVCGGASEGQEGNLLTPEVEEVSCDVEESHRTWQLTRFNRMF